MDSILSNDIKAQPLPDGPESDSSSPSKTDASGVDKQAKAEAEKPKVEPQAKPGKTPETDGDETEDEHVPDDLDGIKRALAAARGDKRKARKKWQETEQQLAELRGKLAVYQQGQRPMPGQPQPQQATPEGPKGPTDDEFYAAGPVGFITQREQELAKK